MSKRKNQDVYFATLPTNQLVDELKNKVNDYRNTCRSNGQAGRWALSLGTYYGASPDGKISWQVTSGGEYGELVQQKVNDYASYVRHELVLAVKDRPAGRANAVNSDPSTLRSARVGTSLVEYFFSDPAHAFENDYVKALELALLTAEAYVVQDWDTATGEAIAVEPVLDENGMETGEEREVMSGDLTQEVYPVWNAARDLGAPTPKVPWMIFSKFVNKFELAAKYPAHRDDIVTQGTDNLIVQPLIMMPMSSDTDYVEQHLFIHLPSKALPQGRYALMCGDAILLDAPFPYKAKNFHRVADRDVVGTSYGHTSNYDLLGLEQVTDMLHSSILSNQSTFAISTVVGPKGGGVVQTELTGLRYIEVDPEFVDKIKPLNLTSTPPEVFAYEQRLSQKKGELSGINSILRGDPQGALKGASGSAMALLQSQALVFNSGVQRAFYQLLNACGTGIIEICRQFAGEPRIIRIAGKANSGAVQEFKYDSDTLSSVSTVVFEAVNPVLQTAAGKLQIAQDLLSANMIKSPKRYIEVLTTGNLNVLIEDDVAMEEAILEENERLSEGEYVEAVIIEDHKAHIAAHQSVISRPNAKQDPQLVENVQAHILQHINLWTQATLNNPGILYATGQEPIPMAPPQGPQGMPPQGGPQGSSDMMNPNASDPNEPQLPQPPVDPSTGQRVQLPSGSPVRQ